MPDRAAGGGVTGTPCVTRLAGIAMLSGLRTVTGPASGRVTLGAGPRLFPPAITVTAPAFIAPAAAPAHPCSCVFSASGLRSGPGSAATDRGQALGHDSALGDQNRGRELIAECGAVIRLPGPPSEIGQDLREDRARLVVLLETHQGRRDLRPRQRGRLRCQANCSDADRPRRRFARQCQHIQRIGLRGVTLGVGGRRRHLIG